MGLDNINNSDLYQEGLRSYLHQGGEHSLNSAYELGRQNLAAGMGLLELTFVHQQALDKVLYERPVTETQYSEGMQAANRFLNEALSPFEVSRLSGQQANNALLKLYDVFESEAKRIAHRLHDDSAQMLAVVYLKLSELACQSSPETARQIDSIVVLLDEVCEQLRSLSHELRPLILDQLGLLPALHALAEGVRKRTAIVVRVTGDTGGRLPQEIETVLYRAVQEGLANVSRHAHASHVEVSVCIVGCNVLCSVSDNGVGLALPGEGGQVVRGLGLTGIQERVRALGGESSIHSEKGAGATLTIRIPL